MNEKTVVKLFTLGCAVVIVLAAMMMGHNGNLATLAVIGLFGGEKLLEKFLQIKVVLDDDKETEKLP